MKEEFPELDVTNNLFEIDKDRYSCSGGTSSLDLMLNIIIENHGSNLAKSVSDQLIHERIRYSSDYQRMSLRSRLGVSHPKLLSSVSIMEENLEEPLSHKELSKKANISLRQLERLFNKYLSCTPNQYYLKLRLERSRNLLLQTSMSILSVALASGFSSASHFSKCYKFFYGMSSSYAMKNNYATNNNTHYRSSEGREIRVKYKGKLANTVQNYLGGLRSTCTYINAESMKQMSKCTTSVSYTHLTLPTKRIV